MPSYIPMWLNAHFHPPENKGRWYSARVDGGERFNAYYGYDGVWRRLDTSKEVLPEHNLEYVKMVEDGTPD